MLCEVEGARGKFAGACAICGSELAGELYCRAIKRQKKTVIALLDNVEVTESTPKTSAKHDCYT